MTADRPPYPWLAAAGDNEADGSDRPRLRVGVLLDSLEVPAWVLRVLQEIDRLSHAELALVVLNAKAKRPRRNLSRLWELRRFLLYEAFVRFDRYRVRPRADAFARLHAGPLLKHCPTLLVVPRQTRFSDYFEPSDLDQIRGYRLDLAIRFGFRILRGEALDIARFGVWSYHHGDNQVMRGGPPGFWEVLEGRSITGATLQILTEELDGGRVICRTYSPTDRGSVVRNKNHLYWSAAAMVPRKLHDLGRQGSAALELETEERYRPYSHPLYRKPSNRQLLPLLSRYVPQQLWSRMKKGLLRNQWFLLFHLRRPGRSNGDELFRFRPLLPPRDRFWADPFPILRNDRHYVFFEEYLYRLGRGHISILEIDERGKVSKPLPVLERDYHLSYPFLFTHNGDLFMIPETSRNRTVELYRCVEFPGRWQLESVLLEDVRAVDATLHRDGEEWWMFVNMACEEAAHCNDELQLYYADRPTGPWHPHRANPVVSDARSARPAGSLFRHGNRLFRPSQDCSERYGYAVRIQQVKRLNRGEYSEETVWRILPCWRRDLLGVHTLNRTESLTVVDGLRKVRRL